MELAETYHSLVNGLVDALGASHAIMHVHVGLGIYLAVQLIVRTRRGSMVALNTVFAAEMLNELMDRLATGSWRWPDTLADVALTMMWPVAITLVSQHRRRQWEVRARQAGAVLAGVRG